MEIPDSIRKELELAASRDRVWQALTDPAMLVRWFPTVVAEIDLRPGGVVSLVWDDSKDEGVVEEVVAGERLVFRWRADGSGDPYTRVTVTLEDLPGAGTRLVLVEDGFSAFAEDRRARMVAGNDTGWDGELDELRTLVEAAA